VSNRQNTYDRFGDGSADAQHITSGKTPRRRSGTPQGVSGEWVNQVEWVRADVLDEASWSFCLEGAAAVVSCVGGFAPSAADMERICGDATIAGVEAAAAAGVPRFVFVSVHDYNIPGSLKDQSGYFSACRLHYTIPWKPVERSGFAELCERLGVADDTTHSSSDIH
jgi:nucleoside-diphosphate-sugar epimerase